MLMTIGVVGCMLGVGWAQYRNGLFTSCAMLISVLIAGLTAFNFFEPIADLLEPRFEPGLLVGCEDFLAILVIFCIVLFALRWGTNRLAPEMLDEHGALQYFGGGGVGIVTGYLLGGFFLCAIQTLPLDERFLDFEPREQGEPLWRTIYPADRVWLAMMRHAGSVPFHWKNEATVDEGQQPLTFDRAATFELRYIRHRRSTEAAPPMPYFGEFDREVGKHKPR